METLLIKRIKRDRKDWGIFFTPEWVVDFMLGLIDEDKLRGSISILEPASGALQFLRRMKSLKKDLFARAKTRVGVELNEEIIDHIHRNNYDKDIKVVNCDFLLWETRDKFDLIVGNPPYGIPSLSDHYAIKVDNETKSKYKAIYETWHGKYNVYGAFIEKAIKLLKENGQLIFIVPATFMILDEFKKLREFLSRNGKTEIIYMGSEVFKPNANITTVVLRFVKSSREKSRLLLFDYNESDLKLIKEKRDWNGGIVLFSTEFTELVDEICSFRIDDVFQVRISPRTPEIKNNPDIVLSDSSPDGGDHLPILNSRNLKIGKVVYEPLSGYWIERKKKTELRKFFSKPHVVVSLGFRGNKQIGAAYDYKAYPWMGDVYHLIRERTLLNCDFNLTDEEVVDFLNSEIIRRYVRDTFRDITYHFNVTQIKTLPLPTREELKRLEEALRCPETG
ncbi:Eco57I restriction-modification methylase domain-containing protein [Hydrogenivirga sp.]